MQPINKAERSKAFFNFLLLFILCIGIIITTVFFSIEVPKKQINYLFKENENLQNNRKFQSEFFVEMKTIMGMLDTINNSAKADFLESSLESNIINLNQKVESVKADSIYNQPFYHYIVQNLFDIKEAKKELRKSKAKEDKTNELKEENMQLRELLQRTSAN